MTEDTTAPEVATDENERPPVAAWLARWPLALVLAVLGAAVGAGIGAGVPTRYTAEARVAVGAGDLTTGAVAGFPAAASSLAGNYARYVNNRAKAGPSAVALSASPIPDSNVILIEGESTDEGDARAQVQKTADDLVTTVNKDRLSGDLLARYNQAAATWARASSTQSVAQSELATELARPTPRAKRVKRLTTTLARATSATSRADVVKNSLASRYADQQRAAGAIDLRVVLPAATVSDTHSSSIQRYGLLGFVAGLGLSLLLAVGLERRGARRRRATA